MRLCVFEDSAVGLLEPLTLTRPAWALWCGASTLLERHVRTFAATEVGVLVRPELADLCRLEYPRLAVNDDNFLQGDDVLFINARWLPPGQATIDSVRAHVGFVDGQIAYVVGPSPARPGSDFGKFQDWLDHCRNALPNLEAGGIVVDYLWDLVEGNAEALIQDWHWYRQTQPVSPTPPGVGLAGPPEKLVIAEGAVLEPLVFVDTRQGPVLIDRGAVIHAFSRLEGPCYIGKDSWIMGAKLRGGTIGPKCRIGGEVEASIVQGYANKYHDGFLGHSYIGAWVNLAAGTHTSDLRNDYGTIKVTVAGQRIATGRTKIGSFIGDHSKTGLGALLNTGSAIGVFCNVLPSGSLLPQEVPSFCQVYFGQIRERLDMRQLFTTAATVMHRRGASFSHLHSDLFYFLYDHSASLRQRAIRDAEMRHLRRSV
jgi:UDP-N-acetylglucosamine diphosphorylase / glucose-1-phosphate thymidylyltransferase / UDP-N-acetylgalactosamine diphosphorylase / glucosamine-1-phosphate N-acetyltransferase / galactosamine-1-phosphate N-acetyltransferase